MLIININHNKSMIVYPTEKLRIWYKNKVLYSIRENNHTKVFHIDYNCIHT